MFNTDFRPLALILASLTAAPFALSAAIAQAPAAPANTPAAAPAATPAAAPQAKPQANAQAKPAEPPPIEEVFGKRVRAVRPPLPTGQPVPIVIVGSPALATEAITQLWSKGQVIPVLIDDGTSAAREDIARFVRGVASVTASSPVLINWTGQGDATLPAERAARDAAMQTKLATIWNSASSEAYLDTLSKRTDGAGSGPLGVVAYDPMDDAAPAALALAAYYGQVLVAVTRPVGPVGETWPVTKVDSISTTITDRLDALKISYSAMGDQIDALTLVMNADMRVEVKGEILFEPPFVGRPGESVALTDLLGRQRSPQRQRWAYAAQLPGTAPRAMYRAMSSLFIGRQLGRITAPGGPGAAVVDSYEMGTGWSEFDARGTVSVLESLVGRDNVRNINSPQFALDEWRVVLAGGLSPRRNPLRLSNQTGGGLEAAWINVNTMGNWDFFSFKPGNAEPGDIPLLRVPSIVYFVHSWSLQLGSQPEAVGGRWLDRGAYAYVGSVHEPFLPAFVPPRVVAARQLGGWTWAAANRHTIAPALGPWRVQVVGDALMTTADPAAKAAPRVMPQDVLTTLGAGAERIDEATRARVRAKDFDAASRLLILQGRDADAVRVARALLAEAAAPAQPAPESADATKPEASPETKPEPKPEPAPETKPALAITPAMAEALALAAFRTGDSETLVQLAMLAPATGEVPNELADAIWQGLWPRLESLTPEEARLLVANVRLWNIGRDAFEAAKAIAPVDGLSAAQSLIDRAITRTARPEVVKRLRNARNVIK
jgi:hypothetical protein